MKVRLHQHRERLTAQLSEQMAEGNALDEQIRSALGGLGYGI